MFWSKEARLELMSELHAALRDIYRRGRALRSPTDWGTSRSDRTRSASSISRFAFGCVLSRKYLLLKRWADPEILAERSRLMILTHSCIVTDNIDELRAFYRAVLEIEPRTSDGYAEFPTDGGALSLWSREQAEQEAPGAFRSGANRSIMLEFEVADADAQYARLQSMDIDWVKPPSTQAWGNRSIYFRDPDGNLINVYSRVAKR
jgi:catechol 2,3-dioxygenase-like lactoylglutathione lyase family enzyme